VDRFQLAVDRALDELGVDRGEPVVVACSGGPDSAALAHAAMALARAGRLGPVTLCYVDHQLRPDSAADGGVVSALARAGGADAAIVTVEVPRTGGSLEAAARTVRYQALEREAAGRTILVGHTARDQIETVLMRMLRGTGVAGLAGIPARRGRIVRPLLRLGRDEVEAYCARHQIAAADDPSNRDLRHFRNRIRLEILPSLRRVNPAIERSLLRLADAADQARAALEYGARALDERARTADGWRVAELAAAPREVLAHFLAGAVGAAGGGPLGSRHQEAHSRLVGSGTDGSARVDLPGLAAWREYGILRLGPGRGDGPPLEATGPDAPYQVRLWRPGDRMQPARLRGRSRKLSDLFIDARVPRRVRPEARVVVRPSDGRIEWAEHIGVAFGSSITVVTLTPRDPLATNKNR
jgi:tRNA(Ile)-lysidine synthase